MKAAMTFMLFVAAVHAAAAPAAEQTYPTRPVRLVVPFPPGAASDFLARVLGQKLTESWGQQVVIDNRPGAGGLIGGTVVAKAAPSPPSMDTRTPRATLTCPRPRVRAS